MDKDLSGTPHPSRLRCHALSTFRRRGSLFDPDQVKSKRLCSITLSDIGSDKGNGQA